MKPPAEDEVNIAVSPPAGLRSAALPPAVVVHALAQARAALAPGRPVTLLSAPGAVRYAGCLWWAELLRAADYAGPAFLDCADATGRAVEALRLGLGIVLDVPDRLFALVAAEAAAGATHAGAAVLRRAPPALDLGHPAALRQLPAWLGLPGPRPCPRLPAADDTAETLG